MVVKVLIDYRVAELITQVFRILHEINLVAGSILGGLSLRGKENVVVVFVRAQRPSSGIIIPFLGEQDASFCPRVRLKGVGMQADYRKYAATFSNEITDTLVGRIIKSALRQDNCHPPARPEEIQIAF